MIRGKLNKQDFNMRKQYDVFLNGMDLKENPLSKEAQEKIQVAFFAGYMQCLKVIGFMSNPENGVSDEEAGKIITNLQGELDSFFLEYIKKMITDGGPEGILSILKRFGL